MKSIKKFLFIMVALATALAFVSCSNGSDDGGSNNSNSNVVAMYEADSEATVLKFFNDNTWSLTDCSSKNETFLGEGTYKGNPAKNAKIYITLVKYMDWDINEVYEIPSNKQEELTVEIKSGILKLDFYFNQDDEVESFIRK